MTTPVTTLDPRFSDPDAAATGWEQTRQALGEAELFWIATVRADGRPHMTPLVAVWAGGALYGFFYHQGSTEPVQVFAVVPAKVLAFSKGAFSHTRHVF